VNFLGLILGATLALLLQSSPAFAEPLVLSPLDCPTPHVIDARVREILGAAPEAALPERASVLPEGESLRVTLRAADGRVLGDRVLPVEGDCETQAAAVAVLLATWLSDVHPEFVGNLPEAPAPAEPAEPPTASPPPPEPGKPPAKVAAPSAATAPARDSAPAHSETGRGVPRWELAAAFGAGTAPGSESVSASPQPVGSLSLRYFPRDTGWGAALSVSASTARRAKLSNGSIRYFRVPLLLGPAFRWRAGSTLLDASVGGVAAWLHVAGTNFEGGSTHDVVALGGALSGRLALPQGRLAPFLEVTGAVYQSGQAYVTRGSDTPSVDLPRLELFAVLGGSFRAF
jgi:hypothetical protein